MVAPRGAGLYRAGILLNLKPPPGWEDMAWGGGFGGGCSAQANLYVTQFMYLQNIRCHYRDLDVYIGSTVYSLRVPIHNPTYPK